LLTNETNEDSIEGNPSSTKIHKPPIFVHGVMNYEEMIKRIRKMNRIAQKFWHTMLLK